MIDQHSAISSQHSALTENAYQPGNNVNKSDNGNRTSDVNDHKEEYKKVAREMESLFAYQLLKVMRETTNNLSADKKDNGHDTYMSMFDMEISRLFSERGIGLQDAIINWLERSPVITEKNINVIKSQD
ncbi:MAG: rod-binding protein [Nitrospirae bacterium]|nr:rod-binding protein [Nitrospirota bacterium]